MPSSAPTAVTSSPRRSLSVHGMLTGALLLWFLAGAVTIFLPVHWLHVLPEHEATRRPARWHPFIPNLSIDYDPWVGETATTGNLTPLEKRSPIRFSTDQRGFRYTPGFDPAKDVDLVLFTGSSFAYGGGLSDDETLPAVLTRDAGLNTYNGGQFWWDPQTPQFIERLVGELGKGRRSVLMICWEDADFNPQPSGNAHWPTDGIGARMFGSRYWDLRDSINFTRRYTAGVTNIVPLEVLSIRLFKALSNDVVFPNRYRAAVDARQLPDGRRMLFLNSEMERALHPPDQRVVHRNADYFTLIADRLAKAGVKAHVILIPNRYTIYGPLLDGPRIAAPGDYLSRIENELRARHLSVLNLYPALAAHAQQDLTAQAMSFYLEDHHWTPLGVRRVAKVLAPFLNDAARKGGEADAVQ
jgi:hypothetical protein